MSEKNQGDKIRETPNSEQGAVEEEVGRGMGWLGDRHWGGWHSRTGWALGVMLYVGKLNSNKKINNKCYFTTYSTWMLKEKNIYFPGKNVCLSSFLIMSNSEFFLLVMFEPPKFSLLFLHRPHKAPFSDVSGKFFTFFSSFRNISSWRAGQGCYENLRRICLISVVKILGNILGSLRCYHPVSYTHLRAHETVY